MGRCFVIQPFDKGPYDKRYLDIFVPAICSADLEPYRVDEDPSATVIIDDIEEGIRNAEICLAEISTDNPNIWYEVGYALASRKPVVFVCTAKRKSDFPFDIRHRNIISYNSDSVSDFQNLGEEITKKLKAQLKKSRELQDIAEISSVKETKGLTPHEMAAMVVIMGEVAPNSGVAIYKIKQEMANAGFNAVGSSLSLEGLRRKGMLEFVTETDHNGYEYPAAKLTDSGIDWMLANQDRLVITNRNSSENHDLKDEDIPF